MAQRVLSKQTLIMGMRVNVYQDGVVLIVIKVNKNIILKFFPILLKLNFCLLDRSGFGGYNNNNNLPNYNNNNNFPNYNNNNQYGSGGGGGVGYGSGGYGSGGYGSGGGGNVGYNKPNQYGPNYNPNMPSYNQACTSSPCLNGAVKKIIFKYSGASEFVKRLPYRSVFRLKRQNRQPNRLKWKFVLIFYN